jgi:hypothetical protein
MPLTTADLESAFKTYFDEIDRCISRKCYWALLHVVVVLPDVCAALESDRGEAGSGGPYMAWCKANFTGRYLSAADRYEIRCALLHQGRTTVNTGRFVSYSFVQPFASNTSVHNWVTPNERNITLDVGEMARETKSAIRIWFEKLRQPAYARKSANVERHLRWLAREKPKTMPGLLGTTTFSSTSTST